MATDVTARRNSLAWRALLAATVVPPLIVFVLIFRFGVNVPFQDDWDTASVLIKWRNGSLTAGDFWAQQSEHRIATVRAVIWAVGAVSELNVVWLMCFGALSAAVALVLYGRLIRRCFDSDTETAAFTGAGSLLLFTLVL